MATRHMKSSEVRKNWADTLDSAKAGDEIVIMHYDRRPAARLIPEDPSIVVLRTGSASQAERLRRLAAEHGALGIPFPNNGHPGWRVVDENGAPVPTNMIPSVQVETATSEEN
ncbi:hypothetical protein ACQEU3_46610 [Spirillospora sp. CA-253888]